MVEDHCEPIAVVGSACRFPGGAHSPAALAELLKNPQDLAIDIPPERFDLTGYYHPDGSHHGSTNVRQSYLLGQDIRRFDSMFFNISPNEADSMDPQQRLLLETVYEALESGGHRMDTLRGSNTAVYTGTMSVDYNDTVSRDLSTVPTYFGTGSNRAIISNRVSYFFDWHGPSMTIDTACSSSLIAIHMGVQSLRIGESRVAVGCGTQVILNPETYVIESKLNMLSPTSRSRMWDADADGYARGEGVAAIVMKRLSDAIADGDHIECIIRETGTNQDGHSDGITVPSTEAQAALIRQTYTRAGLRPETNVSDRPQFFEAHGTGTKAGDPKEAAAIHEIFGSGKESSGTPLYVGSIKTVIGHLEGSAGVAGLLKASAMVQNGDVYPNLLFNRLNPDVAPFYQGLEVPTQHMVWPKLPNGVPRRVSVNSFGFGGSNAHAIIEQWHGASHGSSEQKALAIDEKIVQATPFIFSAHSETSLLAQLQAYSNYLESNAQTKLGDLAWTLQARRTELSHRTAFSASSISQLKSKIDAKLHEATKTQHSGIGTTAKARQSAPKIMAVFTGQGAQWSSMGSQLLKTSEFVRRRVLELDEALATLRPDDRPAWRLGAEMLAEGEDSRVSSAVISQPLCTAIQILLVDLLKIVGVRFDVVVGHSSGEIAAAYAAGFISAQDAIRIAYYRGLVLQDAKRGAMMAVGASWEDVTELTQLRALRGRIAIAAHNSSASVTLSGDADGIAKAKEILDEEKKFARLLKVDKAYHSHHMVPCGAAYVDALRSCIRQPTQRLDESCAWFSSVKPDSAPLDYAQDLQAEYWKDNLTSPVLFAQAVQNAVVHDDQIGLVLEVGPHPALKGPATQNISDVRSKALPYCGTLNRGVSDIESLSDTLGFLWTHLGARGVDFKAYTQLFSEQNTKPRLVTGLPTYKWDHNRDHWSESRRSRRMRGRKQAAHELLGILAPDSTEHDMRWTNVLKQSEIEWLEGHKLQGQTVFPAAGYIAMALEASRALEPSDVAIKQFQLSDFSLERAITFEDSGNSAVETLVTLTKIKKHDSAADAFFSCYALPVETAGSEAELERVATCTITVTLETACVERMMLSPQNEHQMSDVDSERFYSSLSELGYHYSGPFRTMRSMRRKFNSSTGVIDCFPYNGETASSYLVHPCTMDMAFQLAILASSAPRDGVLWSLHLPTAIQSIRVDAAMRSMVSDRNPLLIAHATSDGASNSLSSHVDLMSEDEQNCLVRIENLSIRPFAPATKADDRLMFTSTKLGLPGPDGSCIVQEDKPSAADVEAAIAGERISYYYHRKWRSEITESEWASGPPHQLLLRDWIDHTISRAMTGNHPSLKKEWSKDSGEDIKALASKHWAQIGIRLLIAVGDNMAAAIRGETTILEHMSAGGMLDEFYDNRPGLSTYQSLLAAMAKQITFRYPHAKFIEIGAGTGGATKPVLKAVHSTMSSYTYTDISRGFFEKAAESFSAFSDKMLFRVLDIEKPPQPQGYEPHSYDVAIAFNVLHATRSLEKTLTNVRQLLKPGGYLMLLEVTNKDPVRFGTIMAGLPGWWLGADDGRTMQPTVSTREWHSVLRKSGFSGVDTEAPEIDGSTWPISVLVSRAVDDRIQLLLRPLSSSAPMSASLRIQNLVILGTESIASSRISEELVDHLSGFCDDITVLKSLPTSQEALELNPLSTFINLVDLDSPIFKGITTEKMEGLQSMYDSAKHVLWITHGALVQEPYHMSSIAFNRTVRREAKHISLNHLDLSDLKTPEASRYIAEHLLRLCALDEWVSDEDEVGGRPLLWSKEPEAFLDGGKLMLPRLLPEIDQNSRMNASRRVIRKTILSIGPDRNLGVQCDSLNSPYDVVELPMIRQRRNIGETERLIMANHSTVMALRVMTDAFLYLVAGVDGKSGDRVIGFSAANTLRTTPVVTIGLPSQGRAATDMKGFIIHVASQIVASSIAESVVPGARILVNCASEEDVLVQALCQSAATRGAKIILVVDSPASAQDRQSATFIQLSCRMSRRIILRTLQSAQPTHFLDLTEGRQNKDGNNLGRCIVPDLPKGCRILRADTLFQRQSRQVQFGNKPELTARLEGAVSRALLAMERSQQSLARGMVVPLHDIRGADFPLYATTVVSWAAEAPFEATVRALDTSTMFSADKTYILVGLSGEIGQSLCKFMVANGAGCVCLTSRRPNIDKGWLASLQQTGSKVRVFSVDVTDKDGMEKVVNDIRASCPPIAGVAHGAMVLSDALFSKMTASEMTAVLGPKIIGAIHLDEIFCKDELDFFMLFSSVSCIMGNVGQSNYAAANGYLNGLATQRRKRGLAASVFDIGRVEGLGYMETASQEVVDQLLALGLKPLSESDLHHAFAETILIGYCRPEDQLGLPEAALTTSIRHFFRGEDIKGPWFSNPLFSHLVLETAASQNESTNGASRNSPKSMLRVGQQVLNARSVEEAAAVLKEGFTLKLQAILQIFDEALDPHAPLVQLGIDSLVAVEVRSWFLKELKVDVPVLKIIGGTSLIDLCGFALAKLPSDSFVNIGSEPGAETTKPLWEPKVLPGSANNDTEFSSKVSTQGSDSAPQSSGITLASSGESVQSGIATTFSQNEASEDDARAASKTPLREHRTTAQSLSPVPLPSPATKVTKKVPISFAQSRYWFLHHLVDQQTSNVAYYYRFEGELRANELARALRVVCARHEALRTCFLQSDEDATPAYQCILARSPVTLRCESISSEHQVEERFQELRSHVFDLASGELLQMVLLTLSPACHYLLIHHHHILMDGVSVRVFLSDLEKAYQNLALGPTPRQYPDFSVAQRQDFEHGNLSKELQYWRSLFPAGAQPPTLPLLPMARTNTRAALTVFDTHEVHCRLLPDVTAKIRQVSKSQHATPFQFYLAAFHTLLFRFTDIDDLVIGMADAARNSDDDMNSIGFFLNLLPLKFQSRPEQSFIDAIAEARTTSHAALERSRIPFDILLTELGLDRSSAHSPLFQAFIDYRQGSPAKQSWAGSQFELKKWHLGKTAYDITVDVTDIKDGAMVMLRAQKSLYDLAAAELLLEAYTHLLQQFASNPNVSVKQPPLFTEQMIEHGLLAGRGAILNSTWPETLPHRIDQVALEHPDKVALQDSSGASLTYSAMISRVEALSEVLQDAHVCAGDRVLVLQQASIDWICCMLAIMRIGAVYVPTDSRNPVLRLSALAIECAPKAILADATTTSDVPRLGVPQARHIDISKVPANPKSRSRSSNSAHPDAPAAILFTSGSTGTPKGIVVSHKGLRNEIEGYTKTWGLRDERVLQQSAFTFNFASDQIFTGLVNGGMVYVASGEARTDPVHLTDIIQRLHITYTRATPSEYLLWLQYGRDNLRLASDWRFAFAGGEKLTGAVIQELRNLKHDKIRFFNSYGTAETSISSCKSEVKYNEMSVESGLFRIPSGYSLPNYHTFIVDDKLRPQPVGMPGEVCIGGAGVAIGYLNNSELTDRHFINNPFTTKHDAAQGWTRMYRTGDIAHLNKDGALVVRGRIKGDTQVKLRGIRIDLTDAESTILAAADGILKEAVVTLRGDDTTQFLVAHVVFRPPWPLTEKESFLAQLLSRLPLPQYMVPAAAVPVDELPLTHHSKLDRKAVMSMALPNYADMPDVTHDTKMTETMVRLRSLWKGVVGNKIPTLGSKIGPSTNFFHVGGNSLLIIPLRSRIREDFGVVLPLIELLNANSLLEMAGAIDAAAKVTAINWDVETTPPDIPAFLSGVCSVDKSSNHETGKTIFVTGGTGFLGRHLLKTLVESPAVAKIHCTALRERRHDDTQVLLSSDKITYHHGDLTAPLLGLDEDTFRALASKADIILHLGASRSIWDDYHVLRSTNVQSTRELIKMAGPRRIPIHFVSTTAVSTTGDASIAEPHPAPSTRCPDGYTATKWASERLLSRALEKLNVPSMTYRFLPTTEPSPAPQSLLDTLIRFADSSRLVPDAASWKGLLYMTPVGVVSQMMTENILSDTVHEGAVVNHHQCEVTLTGDEISAHVRLSSLSGDLEEMPILKWFGKLKRSGFAYLIASHDATVGEGLKTKR